jgi:hypothetical protein
MDNNLVDKFGPCGLLCEKCFAFNNGPIHFHADLLKKNLGEFDNYAKDLLDYLIILFLLNIRTSKNS